jgi:hypothetical protein
MQMNAEMSLTGRQRSRLRRARETGCLNAICRDPAQIRDAHSFWCWKLRLPVVWVERLSPRSKFGRVSLDLFTTSSVLTERGRAELRRLGIHLQLDEAAWISNHDAHWSRVPLHQLDALARSVLRAARRAGNCESAAAPSVEGASNILPWRISA